MEKKRIRKKKGSPKKGSQKETNEMVKREADDEDRRGRRKPNRIG